MFTPFDFAYYKSNDIICKPLHPLKMKIKIIKKIGSIIHILLVPKNNPSTIILSKKEIPKSPNKTQSWSKSVFFSVKSEIIITPKANNQVKVIPI